MKATVSDRTKVWLGINSISQDLAEVGLRLENYIESGTVRLAELPHLLKIIQSVEKQLEKTISISENLDGDKNEKEK